MLKTLVVIPTYIEAENIADILRRVRAAAPSVDILVVDDNSPDGTADLARAAGEELGQVGVLVRPGKGGLGVAYRAGFETGFERGYEVLVQMDADFSHPPEKLPELLQRIDEGADVAIGSRYVPGGSTPHWPFRRRALSRIGNYYASRMLGLQVNDATAGFRAYRSVILQQLESASTRATGYGFQVELNYRAHRLGATIVEVPITFNDRVRGVSKMSWHIIGEAMTLVTWWGVRDRVFKRFPGGARRQRRFPTPAPAPTEAVAAAVPVAPDDAKADVASAGATSPTAASNGNGASTPPLAVQGDTPS
ncbi:MAG TPA: polyprenol monophosphomannose synthase [Acidimicrobiales bacterium]|nr:polyprenol monophosphomannose synthase [Acidimicrobiales bacterium]